MQCGASRGCGEMARSVKGLGLSCEFEDISLNLQHPQVKLSIDPGVDP